MFPIETIKEIKNLASEINVNGEKVKKLFVEKLALHAPELLHIFSQILQKSGRSKISLIQAVYSAAMQIEHIDRFVPTMMQVAHKHRSLGIQPEHYPVVLEHLTTSIQEALGERATDKGMAALQLAYNRLADVFIQVERDLYQAIELEGGWRLFKPFRILNKELKNNGAMLLRIVPLDGKIVPVIDTGQYVSVRIKIANETCFSNNQYAVSEGKEFGGYVLTLYPSPNLYVNDRVTDYLLDGAVEGDLVEVSAPAGLFVLKKTDNPITFISEGIGAATLKHLLDSLDEDTENSITYIQYAKNQEVTIYQEALQRKVESFKKGTYEVCYQDHYGECEWTKLSKIVHQKNAEIYLCGSKRFMDQIVEQLHKENDHKIQIHRTFFDSTLFL